MKKVNNIKVRDYEGSIYGACKYFNIPLNVFCVRYYQQKLSIEEALTKPYRKHTKIKKTIEERRKYYRNYYHNVLKKKRNER